MAKSPIAEYKEADVTEGREYLLRVIRDEDTTYKEGTEAVKLLFRSHHALQVDRTVVKATATSGPNIEPDKQKEILNQVDEIINANLYGREADTGSRPM